MLKRIGDWAYRLLVKYWSYIFVGLTVLYLIFRPRKQQEVIQAPIIVPPIRESGPVVEMINDRIQAIEIETKDLSAEDVAKQFNQRAGKRE